MWCSLRTALRAAALLLPLSAVAADPPNWSKDATVLETDAARAVAPGGKNAVGHGPAGMMIEAAGHQIPLAGVPASPPLIDVLWSPDGRSFAITGTNGGTVGPWYTTVYEIDTQGQVLLRDLSGLLATETKDFAQCDAAEGVNTGAVAWRGPTELLIAVEVPPHSSCRNMGAKIGLRIDVKSLTVLQRLSDADLKSTAKGKLLR